MSRNQSKSNVFLIVLLTILIIAVLGFGGYFVWKLEENDNKQTPTNSIATNTQSEKKNNDIDENTEQESTTIEEPEPEPEIEPEPEPEPEPVETKEDYMNSCATYTYKEIARNPNSYIGKRAKIVGEVIQVQQEGNEVVLRVNMTKDQYGYYDDTIMAGYAYADENEDRILEGDIITIYGELYGTITYTSVLGTDVTVPAIKTMYLDIKK